MFLRRLAWGIKDQRNHFQRATLCRPRMVVVLHSPQWRTTWTTTRRLSKMLDEVAKEVSCVEDHARSGKAVAQASVRRGGQARPNTVYPRAVPPRKDTEEFVKYTKSRMLKKRSIPQGGRDI